MESLPTALYLQIRIFLTHHEYLRVLNTSKKTFHVVKYETFYFTLSESAALKFLLVKEFQFFVLQKMKDPKTQLALNLLSDIGRFDLDYSVFRGLEVHSVSIANYTLTHFDDFQKVSNLILQNSTIMEINSLPSTLKNLRINLFSKLSTLPAEMGRLQEVIVSDCNNLLDLSPLKDIPYLTFQSCSFNDISCLGQKQKKIDFHSCVNLEKINHLGKVTELNFHCCTKIENVYGLGKVTHLTFQSCPKVRDVSSLMAGNYSLEVEDCHPELVFPSSLQSSNAENPSSTIRTFHLSGYDESPGFLLSLYQFKSLRELEISCCSQLFELDISFASSLPFVRSLTIKNCVLLSFIHPSVLENLKTFVLANCQNMISLSLDSLLSATVDNLSRRIKKMTIQNCHHLENLHECKMVVEELKIINCNQFMKGFPVINFETKENASGNDQPKNEKMNDQETEETMKNESLSSVVTVIGCRTLRCCHDFQFIQRLTLSYCPLLESLRGLDMTHLQFLVVDGCSFLKDITVLVGFNPAVMKQVSLKWCSALSEVSALNGIPDVQILKCPRVKNVLSVPLTARLEVECFSEDQLSHSLQEIRNKLFVYRCKETEITKYL
jgi:hypothetical protein